MNAVEIAKRELKKHCICDDGTRVEYQSELLCAELRQLCEAVLEADQLSRKAGYALAEDKEPDLGWFVEWDEKHAGEK